MSFIRKIHWTCDYPDCDVTHITKNFGLPEGWIYTNRANEPLQHYCPNCKWKKMTDKDGEEYYLKPFDHYREGEPVGYPVLKRIFDSSMQI